MELWCTNKITFEPFNTLCIKLFKESQKGLIGGVFKELVNFSSFCNNRICID
jgi:hypothetical protein